MSMLELTGLSRRGAGPVTGEELVAQPSELEQAQSQVRTWRDWERRAVRRGWSSLVPLTRERAEWWQRRVDRLLCRD